MEIRQQIKCLRAQASELRRESQNARSSVVDQSVTHYATIKMAEENLLKAQELELEANGLEHKADVAITFSIEEMVALGNLIEGHPLDECIRLAKIYKTDAARAFINKVKSLPYTEIPPSVPTLDAM